MSSSESPAPPAPSLTTDPWSPGPVDAGARRWLAPLAGSAAAVALGVVGSVIRMGDHGPAEVVGLWYLGAAAVALQCSLRAVAARRATWAVGAGVVSVGLALLGVVPHLGRAPVIVVFVAVAVADAGVFAQSVVTSIEWFGPGPDRAHCAPAPATLGLLTAAVAQGLWAADVTALVTITFVALAGLLVLAERAGNAAVRTVSSWLRRGVVRLASSAGLLALLVIALPTLYVPGALARLWAAAVSSGGRWDDERTNWVRHEVRRDGEIRDATVPYSRVPARLRRQRNTTGVIVIAVIVGVAALLWRSRIQDRDTARDQLLSGATVTTQPGTEIKKAIDAVQAVPFSERPAYRGVEFADALQDELQRIVLAPNPAGDYRPEDFDGTYTSIRDGVRVSSTPRCDGCPTTRLWLVGGSAAFGLGQRDDRTIASDLVRLAERDGIALEVRNLGVPGWTLWQEHQAVAADLAATDAAPDMIVFFDGYNDVAGTISTSVVHGVDPSAPVVMDPADSLAFLKMLPEIDKDLDPAALGRLAAKRYASLQRQIVTELDAQGVGSAFFFQPDALTTPVQEMPVERLYRGTPLAPTLKYLPTALETASRALAPQVHDLRHLFDDFPRVVFADTVHTNEEGAKVTASAMYDVLREAIASRAQK